MQGIVAWVRDLWPVLFSFGYFAGRHLGHRRRRAAQAAGADRHRLGRPRVARADRGRGCLLPVRHQPDPPFRAGARPEARFRRPDRRAFRVNVHGDRGCVRRASSGVHRSRAARRAGRGAIRCSDGHRVVPLQDGDAAFPAMLAAIDAARVSVTLVSYIFDTTPWARRSSTRWCARGPRRRNPGVDRRRGFALHEAHDGPPAAGCRGARRRVPADPRAASVPVRQRCACTARFSLSTARSASRAG